LDGLSVERLDVDGWMFTATEAGVIGTADGVEAMKLTSNSEKHKLAEDCEKLCTTIKQMHISLDGKDAAHALDDELLVTYPLQPCLLSLREKHKTISKLHRERYEQVKSNLPIPLPTQSVNHMQNSL
jgi:hypothetical protein